MEPFPFDLPLFTVRIQIDHYLVTYGPFTRLRRDVLVFQCAEATIIQLKNKYEFIARLGSIRETHNLMVWNDRPVILTPEYKDYLSGIYDQKSGPAGTELSYRLDGDVWEVSPAQPFLCKEQFVTDAFGPGLGTDEFVGGKVRLTGSTPIEPQTFAFSRLTELDLGRSLVIPREMLSHAEMLQVLTGHYVKEIPGFQDGGNPFGHCNALSHVIFPMVETVGWGVFQLRTLVVADLPRVRELGERCFYGTLLEQANFPLLEIVPAYCFQYTTNLRTVDLHSVKRVLENGFAYSRLEFISLPNVEVFGGGTFYQCELLKNVHLPKLRETGSNIFVRCSELTNVSLPSLLKLETHTFVNCNLLRTIDLKNVEEVNLHAFTDCRVLNKVHFQKLKTIHKEAFVNCPYVSYDYSFLL